MYNRSVWMLGFLDRSALSNAVSNILAVQCRQSDLNVISIVQILTSSRPHTSIQTLAPLALRLFLPCRTSIVASGASDNGGTKRVLAHGPFNDAFTRENGLE
jgi:hypothetical protein